MNIRSFSGTHAYQDNCVRNSVFDAWFEHLGADAFVERLAAQVAGTTTAALERGNCPRCLDPLPTEHPGAGSRITRCRCIPVCSQCGRDEGWQAWRFQGISRLDQWPVSKGAITRRENIVAREVSPVVGLVVGDGVLTEQGVGTLDLTPRSGGWAELGVDM